MPTKKKNRDRQKLEMIKEEVDNLWSKALSEADFHKRRLIENEIYDDNEDDMIELDRTARMVLLDCIEDMETTGKKILVILNLLADEMK